MQKKLNEEINKKLDEIRFIKDNINKYFRVTYKNLIKEYIEALNNDKIIIQYMHIIKELFYRYNYENLKK